MSYKGKPKASLCQRHIQHKEWCSYFSTSNTFRYGSFSQGANALVTYTIISGADDSFRIDPESGDLIATKRLDRERRSKYSLLVRADDGLQSSDMRINITVSDVNDHTPKFSRPVYSFDIPEDTTPGKRHTFLPASLLTKIMGYVMTALK